MLFPGILSSSSSQRYFENKRFHLPIQEKRLRMSSRCPYCGYPGEREKDKNLEKNVTFPFVRIIHSGEGWRDARIIPFDEKNALKDVVEFSGSRTFRSKVLRSKARGWVL